MTILTKTKALLNTAWSFVKARAVELNRALAEPQHLQTDHATHDRENSVFQRWNG